MDNKNLGTRNRILRIVLGLILIILSYKFVQGFYVYLGYLVGFLLIITGIIGFCAMYYILGYSGKGSGVDKISKRDIEEAIKNSKLNNPNKEFEMIKPVKEKTVPKKVKNKNQESKDKTTISSVKKTKKSNPKNKKQENKE